MTPRPERGEMVPMVFDGAMVDDETVAAQGQGVPRLAFPRWRAVVGVAGDRVRAAVRCPAVVHARSVARYRVRQAPRDAVRLSWFLVRGVGRWGAKGWRWASHADLRADARAARLAGDVQARRTAQETIRADARVRWARAGGVVRRVAVGAAVATVVLVLLALGEMVAGREVMPGWLRAVYAVRDAIGHGVAVGWPWVWRSTVCALVCAAVWEGRDRTPGASWITRPDRDDDGSWVDERMISKALAHLGIAPLNAFLRGGGELVYTVPARRDGDGTHARIRLPLGVTADMVCDRRRVLAGNLGRASLETWPTTGEEDGVLDLWVADKGTLSGGAGGWPLLHEGTVDVFDGVPVGLSQRGVVVAPPLPESNWLIGGRPGQGKTNLLRVLLLGAALDPTCELWVFVMGESPDFEPLRPRLSRYRMGLDDTVAADAVRALEDLCAEMERRGRILGEQPGRPPKVSRRLADKPALGLHPLIMSIDECHELFQHPRYGKSAEEFAVRLIKRGRKYGIVLLLATQSPTKDSIPREVTRNVSCGAAFAVADHIANDGLLGSGRYRAGIRATELRMRTDRGTCVAVGVTDATFELVRTFYVPFEDGADLVTPVVVRALEHMASTSRTMTAREPIPEIMAAPVDHLEDIHSVIGDEPRVRTQVVLARLAAHNPGEYEPWSARDLRAALLRHGVHSYKSDGAMVVRVADVVSALARRPQAIGVDEDAADVPADDREAGGTQGVIPASSGRLSPSRSLRKGPSQGGPSQTDDEPANGPHRHLDGRSADSLPPDVGAS